MQELVKYIFDINQKIQLNINHYCIFFIRIYNLLY